MDIALLTSLDNIDFREWCELTCSTKKCIDFCQNVGLIGFTLNEPCAQGHNNWKLGSCARASDEFFASESTIVDWKNFARDLCGEHFSRHPVVIGGPGHIVEIDESAWTKRKYNRGRLVSNQWVFVGIDRDTRECFAVLVDQRDAATLLPIIHQYIRAGTTIYSDQWAAYNGIANGPGPDRYNHQTVNHSVNFVDPTTSTHTQNIENLWMCMKRKKKNQMGQHVTLLGTHLTEYMWRQRFGDRPFENLVRAIQEKYVVQ
ncbi:unnamed protein product [Rotaria socialis]|uniref:ISXO2-like transposase domain-containing protein n=1 Tax=Rotaria socialis TaxID=392032 RepID=A0A821GU09_9BILA|nr:unnamed protein product [Rotaria socialis]